MAEFPAVKTALAAALATLAGLTVYRDPPNSVIVPCAILRPNPDGFVTAATMGGGTSEANDYSFSVLLLTGAADDVGAGARLDAYLDESDPASIVNAVQNNAALNALVDDVSVTPSNEWGYHELAGQLYYGSPFTVDILS